MRFQTEPRSAYLVFGANGSLGKELVELLSRAKPEDFIFAGYREGAQNLELPNLMNVKYFNFDFVSTGPFRIEDLKLKELNLSKIVLLHCVAEADSDYSKPHDLYLVNYLKPIQISQSVRDFCLKSKIELHCVFVLSSVGIYPEAHLVHYSASKAALLNYTFAMMDAKVKDFYLYGIFTGPFRSRLWDEERMRKFVFTQKLNFLFQPENKAKKILKIVDRQRSGLYLNPSIFLAFVKAMCRFSVRSKQK